MAGGPRSLIAESLEVIFPQSRPHGPSNADAGAGAGGAAGRMGIRLQQFITEPENEFIKAEKQRLLRQQQFITDMQRLQRQQKRLDEAQQLQQQRFGGDAVSAVGGDNWDTSPENKSIKRLKCSGIRPDAAGATVQLAPPFAFATRKSPPTAAKPTAAKPTVAALPRLAASAPIRDRGGQKSSPNQQPQSAPTPQGQHDEWPEGLLIPLLSPLVFACHTPESQHENRQGVVVKVREVGTFPGCFSTAPRYRTRYRNGRQMHGSKCIGQQWVPWHHIPAGFDPGISAQKQGVAVGVEDKKLSPRLFVHCPPHLARYSKGRQMLGLDCPPRRGSTASTILTGPGNLVSFFVWVRPSKLKGPQHKARGPRADQYQTSRPCVGPCRRASIVAKCAPEGVPSIHLEGEARQLKTNPFPTQSYPTRKRQVQPISSNKSRDGRVREKFVTSNAAEGTYTTSNADALDAVPASVERDDPPLDTFPLHR
ncbi:hypothetical protein THAOC_36908 [Thalassiosira oceanica]|uniref:Uncharacterized protein n=1 Tax=Thalassiosira oceanica TaxID=159749 RepID=K0RDB8_THAOC|nr:hypothetical protein THAOC_36908 [Thalassiosira oceanica]|eukprot:EJK44542.1 hypothetical protein THAOC_36908 [Thalassiosira oceanica]